MLLFALTALVLATGPATRVAAAPTAITEFSDEVGESPEYLVAGPDGNMWFADYWFAEGSFHGSIGRISPDGTITQLNSGLNQYSQPEQIVVGPDGNLWFADSGNGPNHAAIGRMTPGGSVTEFGGLGSTRPREIIDGPAGELWFAANGSEPAIGKVTTSGKIGKYVLPARPNVPVVGGDGNVWFTYGGSGYESAIGRVVEHPEGSTTITLFHSGLATGSLPWRIVLGADGNLWFADDGEGVGAIGRVTPSGNIQEFHDGLQSDSEPEHLLLGPDGNIWFTDRPAHAVGRITLDGTITEFSNERMVQGGGPHGLAVGAEGELWFGIGNDGVSGIGRISTVGQIIILSAGTSGLSYDGYPEELTSGPDGRLWFVNQYQPTIGRVVPGDDSPPLGLKEPVPDNSIHPAWSPAIRLARGTAAVHLNGSASLFLTCLQRETSCLGQLEIQAKNRGSAVKREIGSARYAIAPGATNAVSVRLNRLGRKWLRLRDGHLKARLVFYSASPSRPPYQTDVRLHQVAGSHIRGHHNNGD